MNYQQFQITADAEGFRGVYRSDEVVGHWQIQTVDCRPLVNYWPKSGRLRRCDSDGWISVSGTVTDAIALAVKIRDEAEQAESPEPGADSGVRICDTSSELVNLQLVATKLCRTVREQMVEETYCLSTNGMRRFANTLDAMAAAENLLGIKPTIGGKSWGQWALEHEVKP